MRRSFSYESAVTEANVATLHGILPQLVRSSCEALLKRHGTVTRAVNAVWEEEHVSDSDDLPDLVEPDEAPHAGRTSGAASSKPSTTRDKSDAVAFKIGLAAGTVSEVAEKVCPMLEVDRTVVLGLAAQIDACYEKIFVRSVGPAPAATTPLTEKAKGKQRARDQ